MNELDRVLDDIDGLHEAFAALGDDARRHALAHDEPRLKALRRELAAAADAYAATVMPTRRGDLDATRVRQCRGAAMDAMPAARRQRRQLATLVEERRVPAAAAVREDVQTLLTLSLHCRAALDSLAPSQAPPRLPALGEGAMLAA